METSIIRLLGQEDYQPSNVPQLLTQLKASPGEQQALQAALKNLVQNGKIIRTKGNRYLLASQADLVAGTLQVTRGGKGFVMPEEASAREITIPENALSTALHGDRVLVRRDPPRFGQKQPSSEVTGSVVRILKRGRKQCVGTLQSGRQTLYVVPDDPRLPRAVQVPPPRDVGREAHVGDKVVVEFVAWDSPQAPPEGEIVEVLGPPDEEGVDMLSVLRHYDLPLRFPKAVLNEAQQIARSRPDNQPSTNEIKGRVDCRGHLVITIDPDDARDFDDAFFLERAGKNQWRLWVHIADVSHYVCPGSPLDMEAKERGNSTYLVDRVIPMLPEALSNELCSLKPGLDRLTKCVEFLLHENGKVISSRFHSAVIHSKRRFTYQEAFSTLQRQPKDPVETMLHAANQLAQAIRKQRFQQGALDLDFPENKIRLDEHGRVKCIEKTENDISHQLIEEFMLLANEAVAGRLMALALPAIYRVHEAPKEKRLNDYREEVLSQRIPCGDLSHRPEVQKLLQRLGQLPVGSALKIGFLRSMMRARYAVEPLGHYGLAKKKYAHFTSPIRRYADLIVHRALFSKKPLPLSDLRQVAEHISLTEKNSADAERDSKEVKLYAYLESQLTSGQRQVYAGLVTDVRNFGFFVEVADLGLSGFVPLSSVPNDFFMLDSRTGALVGRHTHLTIRLGSRIQVRIHRLDRLKKQVDFQWLTEETPASERNNRKPSRKPPTPATKGPKNQPPSKKPPNKEQKQKPRPNQKQRSSKK